MIPFPVFLLSLAALFGSGLSGLGHINGPFVSGTEYQADDGLGQGGGGRVQHPAPPTPRKRVMTELVIINGFSGVLRGMPKKLNHCIGRQDLTG